MQSQPYSAKKSSDIASGDQILPAFTTLPAGRFKKLVPGSFEKANKSKSTQKSSKKRSPKSRKTSVSPVKDNKLRQSLPKKKIIKGGKTSKRNKNYESL